MRCARCQHTWFQEAVPDLPKPIPVEEAPAPTGPVTDKSRMLPPPPGSVSQPSARADVPTHFGFPPVGDGVRQTRSRRLALVFLGVAALAGAILLFFFLRTEIARVWPESASLYEALGTPVNTRGFKIIAQHTQELDNKSVPVIAIKGQIINETDQELPVPKVRIAVRDQSGREIYHWTVLADQERLGPHEQGTFNARLESPPADAYDLEVRFAKADE